MPKRIDFFYVEAGGGHKAAATALQSVIEAKGLPWKVRLVTLNHVLERTDVFKRVFGRGIEDGYNWLLKSGFTIAAPYLMPAMHGLLWLTRRQQVRILREFWGSEPPDMVVSLIPHFNRTLRQAYRGPFVTILTDFADIPPRVWLERQEQYVICGTTKAVDQARAFGHPLQRVFRVSGMILRPSFYDVKPIDRSLERAAIGLRPEVPTILVLFGGEGSKSMLRIARDLGASGLNLQLILMYGRNEELGRKLRDLRLPVPVHVQGFTSEVPRFMQMADFMLGKPGPGSISEALAMKLPVIVDSNAWTLPQERYNAEWLLNHRLGMVVKSWKQVTGAAREMLAPKRLAEYRDRVARVNNRAVFEIPPILETILEK